MSDTTVATDQAAPPPTMGVFERFLTVWVALCIIAGIALGQIVPGAFHVIGNATVAQVNLPVAVLVWLMIVPMLLKVDFGALHRVAEQWRGIAVTVGVNWLVKPFSMALLGWLFVGWLFRPWLPANQIDSYIAGRPSSNPTIGANANTIMTSLSATWLSVKWGSPSERLLQTNTIAVHGAAARRMRPAI